MDKTHTIKKQSEIDAVFKFKKAVSNENFSIFYIKNDEFFRYAISIGKKVGNAVVRNKLKRQIREIVRAYQNDLKNYDFIIVCKTNANQLSFLEIKNNLTKLLIKSKILLTEGEKDV